MKKIMSLLLTLSFITTLIGCGNMKQTIPAKPEDTALEFWITENVEDIDFRDYDEIDGWYGAHEYLGKGYQAQIDENNMQIHPDSYVSYRITAYPDYSDGGSYVTYITIAAPDVTLYGLSIQSSMELFDTVFEDMGYQISNDDSNDTIHIAEKNGVFFSFEEGKEIHIWVEVSNQERIMF